MALLSIVYAPLHMVPTEQAGLTNLGRRYPTPGRTASQQALDVRSACLTALAPADRAHARRDAVAARRRTGDTRAPARRARCRHGRRPHQLELLLKGRGDLFHATCGAGAGGAMKRRWRCVSSDAAEGLRT